MDSLIGEKNSSLARADYYSI